MTSHLVTDSNEPFALTIAQQSSQQILEGTTPAPIVLDVSRGGQPAAAILDVIVTSHAHGVTVTDAHPQSDADGRATVVFAPHTQGHYGQVTVSVVTPDAHARQDAKISILPLYRRIFLLTDNPLQVKKVNDVWPEVHFRFWLVAAREHYTNREETTLNANSLKMLSPGVPVTFSIHSGTTGMRLTESEVMCVDSTQLITLTPPTAPGTCSVTLYTEHCDPVTMTFNVTE